MAVNPNNAKQWHRAVGAIMFSDLRMSDDRKARLMMVDEQLGKWYGARASDSMIQPTPLNYLRLAKRTYTRHLAAKNPRVLVTTPYPHLKAGAARLQMAVNRLIRELDIARTNQLLVHDAMDSVAISKTAIERRFDVGEESLLHEPGMPFYDRVSLDDFVCDRTVTDFRRCAFEGDRYWASIEDIKASPYFGSAKDKVQPHTRIDYNVDGNEKVAQLASNYNHDVQELEDKTLLCDTYFVQENLLVTWVWHQPELVLAVNEWDGPELGPYDILGYGDVPDQMMPLAPLSLLVDLHKLANALWRKMSNQAEGQKSFGAMTGGDNQDIETARNVKDGQLAVFKSLQNLEQMSVGGVDGGNAAFATMVHQMIDFMGNNLSILTGGGPQSETATQDELLMMNASGLLAEMHDGTTDFVKRRCVQLAWYWWNHPTLRVDGWRRIPGTNITEPLVFSPATREGDFIQHNFEIAPYSMRHLTPQQHLSNMRMFLRDMEPYLPMMEARGMVLDFPTFVDLYAEYSNSPEIRDILRFGPVPREPALPAAGEGRMAAHTTREHVRINRSQGTPRGQMQVLGQAFAGGTPQESQINELFRVGAQ